MALFNIRDLTHWSAWGYLLSTWKQKYSLPTGGNYVVFSNLTGGRGKVVINGVKRGDVDVAWTLIFCFQGVTQEWISSVFEMSVVFWITVLPLFSSWYDIVIRVLLVVYDVWFAEDDNTGFVSFGPEVFLQFFVWIEFEDNKQKQNVIGDHRKSGLIAICLIWWRSPNRWGKSTDFLINLCAPLLLTVSLCETGPEV